MTQKHTMNKFSFAWQGSSYIGNKVVNGRKSIDDWRLTEKYRKKIDCVIKEMSKIEYEYCQEINQFHITYRISGNLNRFEDPEGCNTLRLFKKKSAICNSVSFDEKIYSNEDTLKEFLIENLILAHKQMIEKLEKEKIVVDGKRLLKDLAHVITNHFEKTREMPNG